jgi:hypothetical protein
VGFELLHRLGGVVDESKASALSATVVRLETEDGDIILLGLVELGKLAAEFVLGDVGTVGVEDVAGVGCQKQMPFPIRLSTNMVCPDLHDHLATTEERVADELARAQRDLRISHGVGLTVSTCSGREGLAMEFARVDFESNRVGRTEVISIRDGPGRVEGGCRRWLVNGAESKIPAAVCRGLGSLTFAGRAYSAL